MTELAGVYGFGYLKSIPPFRYHVEDRPFGEDETARVREYVESCWKRAHEAGERGLDVAFADVVDQSHEWNAAFRTAVAGEWSVTPEEASTLDSFSCRDTDNNWPVREGYGTLVARHAKGLPVSLSTPGRRIEWSGSLVKVVTDNGIIDAGAVLITVSTRIIQDGVIEFDPPLPVWKQEAYDAIQLGNANKVSFAIDGRELGVDGHSGMWVKVTERQGMFFQLRPFGLDLANGYLAGELSAQAEREGAASIIATGLNALRSVYGAGIEQKITISACSTWQTDPWIRGAYGAARPRLAHMRKDLVTPIDDKLSWAGEAVSHDFFSTCHGAHSTRIAAVKAAAISLKHVRL